MDGGFARRPSSVPRGGKWCYNPSIGLKSMQNSMFWAVLRLIFALKTKIPPPTINEFGVRAGEDREIMMTSKSGCQYTWRPFLFCFVWRTLDFGQKNALNFGEDLFFLFWRSLDFGQKNALNFGEDLFFVLFWRSLDFGQKNALNFGEDLLFSEITWFLLNNCLNPIQD